MKTYPNNGYALNLRPQNKSQLIVGKATHVPLIPIKDGPKFTACFLGFLGSVQVRIHDWGCIPTSYNREARAEGRIGEWVEGGRKGKDKDNLIIPY
jgi:hypothetical protein